VVINDVMTWKSRFCWGEVSMLFCSTVHGLTYDWDSERHRVEGERGKKHDDEDDLLVVRMLD
jgi:hypothetical protein